MEIVERIVFNGRGSNDPQYLIVHETANPGATALNHVAYWSTGNQGGEAQYVADWTGIVYHTTPDYRATWNVGGSANYYTVGIELCHATTQAQFEVVWDTAVEFCAYYLNSQGWGIDKMLSHREANWKLGTGSDHTDPDGYFEEFGKSWSQFVSEVESMMDGGGDMNKEELISTRDAGNIPAWQAWSWGYTYSKDAVDKIAKLEKSVAALQTTVNNLKINGASVDYDKLATAVADKIHQRMKA